MASNLGFGQPTTPKPKSSKQAAERNKAASQLDEMRAKGTPEFEVYARIQGKKQWYPIGVVAVQRSSQINRAIYDSEEQLLKGAVRLYPVLRKYQGQLDYGYRLKEFKDEPIQVAEPPKSVTAVTDGVQNAIGKLTSIFKRG